MSITVSAEYADQIDAIVKQIEHTKMLRDAQRHDDERRTQYQAECTDLTHQLELWKERAPRLEELDGQIAMHNRDLHRSERDANNEDRTMTNIAITCGVVAVLSVALGPMVVSPWLVLLVVLVLTGGAIAAAFRVRVVRQQHADRAEDVRSRLDALETERNQLRAELRHYA